MQWVTGRALVGLPDAASALRPRAKPETPTTRSAHLVWKAEPMVRRRLHGCPVATPTANPWGGADEKLESGATQCAPDLSRTVNLNRLDPALTPQALMAVTRRA